MWQFFFSLFLVLALLPTPTHAQDPQNIACPDGAGYPVEKNECSYYRTNSGFWDGLWLLERGQHYCKTPTCEAEGGLNGLVTFLPAGSQVIVMATMNPLDIHGLPVDTEVCDSTMSLTTGAVMNDWRRDASAIREDITNPTNEGLRVEIWSTVLKAPMYGTNPNLPFYDANGEKSVFMPPNWKPEFNRSDSFMIETFSPLTGLDVNTGPRSIAVMAFPENTFARDEQGGLKLDGAFITQSSPYLAETSHYFGMLSLSGAPVTVVAVDGFDDGKNTCRIGPDGWTLGPDAGNKGQAIERTTFSAYTQSEGETLLPITFNLCPGFTAHWAGAAVAYRRAE